MGEDVLLFLVGLIKLALAIAQLYVAISGEDVAMVFTLLPR